MIYIYAQVSYCCVEWRRLERSGANHERTLTQGEALSCCDVAALRRRHHAQMHKWHRSGALRRLVPMASLGMACALAHLTAWNRLDLYSMPRKAPLSGAPRLCFRSSSVERAHLSAAVLSYGRESDPVLFFSLGVDVCISIVYNLNLEELNDRRTQILIPAIPDGSQRSPNIR